MSETPPARVVRRRPTGYDPYPTLITSDVAAAYANYARSLDTTNPGWHEHDEARMTQGLAAEAIARRGTDPAPTGIAPRRGSAHEHLADGRHPPRRPGGGPTHPTWCDPVRCTVLPDAPHGVHRSRSVKIDTALPFGIDDVDVWLQQDADRPAVQLAVAAPGADACTLFPLATGAAFDLTALVADPFADAPHLSDEVPR